jgi:polyphenol oxidase
VALAVVPGDRTGRLHPGWLVADGLPAGVRGVMTTRAGGRGQSPFDTLNLRPPGLRGGAVDDPDVVRDNQRLLAAAIGARPVFLDQVHGTDCVRLRWCDAPEPGEDGTLPRADASVTTDVGVACTVLVADCLPVLLAAPGGRAVAAAHAGWRGLAGGVLESTVTALCEAAGCRPAELSAWLGACIGPQAFEVGPDVLVGFGVDPGAASDAGERQLEGCSRRFRFAPRPDGSPRWRADLPGLAVDRLMSIGLPAAALRIAGRCTVAEPSDFFSFRRDRVTGRMAACIWIDA